jgi:HlyD family secretion protein
MTRARIGLIVLAVVVVAGIVVWRVRASQQAQRPSFVTTAVEKGNIVGRVTATGTLSALVTVQVGTQVSGRIAALGADFNSPVKKGQLLAKIDPLLFEAAVASARANEQAAVGTLEQAKAQAVNTHLQYVREKALAEQKLVAQADLDTAFAADQSAIAAVAVAVGSLAQARAQLNQAGINLGYTNIYAPTDGTVVSRAVDVGQTVAASLAAPTIFTIAADLTKMQVDTNVAEADVGKLKEGLPSTFSVDAFPGRTFSGRIRQIRFAPQVVTNVVTYDAVIDVDNPELLLRPGMTANVTFIFARADDVLKLPNAALRFRLDGAGAGSGAGGGAGAEARRGGGDDGGVRRHRPELTGDQKRVWVLRDEGPKPAVFEAGLSDGSFTEVRGGELVEGDQVIVDRQAGADGARPGGSGGPGGASGGGMRRMF